MRLSDLEAGASYSQVLEKLCAHDKRNALVVEDVHEAVTAGCTPLVVSKRKDHARMLHHALRSLGKKAQCILVELDAVGRGRHTQAETRGHRKG